MENKKKEERLAMKSYLTREVLQVLPRHALVQALRLHTVAAASTAAGILRLVVAAAGCLYLHLASLDHLAVHATHCVVGIAIVLELLRSGEREMK
jgi:hypothetical protein